MAALRFMGVGFFIGGSIVLGTFFGRWLDTKFDTHLFWIVGLILGIVVAFMVFTKCFYPSLVTNEIGGIASA